jgi:hypothetical protein
MQKVLLLLFHGGGHIIQVLPKGYVLLLLISKYIYSVSRDIIVPTVKGEENFSKFLIILFGDDQNS